MKKLAYILIVGLFISCQIEDSNAPSPTDSFIKYFGELANQEAKDLEPIYAEDGITIEGFVLFGTQQLEDSTADYYVVKTDADGNLLGEVTLGISEFLFGDIDGNGELNDIDLVATQETAGQIHAIDTGGFIIVGTSSLTKTIVDINDFRFITYAFLDSDLNVQFGGLFTIIADTNSLTRDIVANEVIQLTDGSFLIAGAQENASETDFDYYFRRFTADSLYWEKSSGSISGSDEFGIRAFENDDQTISVFGYSADPGANGERGTNVSFLELNENGNILNANSNGILEPNFLVEYDEVLSDVIRIPGGFAAVGTSTVENNRTYGFFMTMSNDGILRDADTLTSEFSQDGTFTTQLQTHAFGLTPTLTNDYVIVGEYVNFRTPEQSRGGEAMFFRVDPDGDKLFGFESNFGVGTGNDVAVDAITLADGKIMMAVSTDFGGGVQLFSLIKLNDSGELDN